MCVVKLVGGRFGEQLIVGEGFWGVEGIKGEMVCWWDGAWVHRRECWAGDTWGCRDVRVVLVYGGWN